MNTSVDKPVIRITPSEFEILSLIAQGASNKEIAEIRGTGVGTVKTHCRNLYHKLIDDYSGDGSSYTSRVKLVLIGQKLGLAKLPDFPYKLSVENQKHGAKYLLPSQQPVEQPTSQPSQDCIDTKAEGSVCPGCNGVV